MFRSMVRKFHKMGKVAQREQINLETISRRLASRADLSMIFDISKLNVEMRFGQFFMILGAEASYLTSPNLLLVYPANRFSFTKDSFSRIAQFCFPRGMKKKEINKKEQITDQFVFGLNDNGSLQFGICTHFYIRANSFLGPQLKDTIYCLCTFTPNPQLNANFQFHSYMVSMINLQITSFAAPPTVRYIEENWEISQHDIGNLGIFSPPLTPHEKCKILCSVHPEALPPYFVDFVSFYMRISTFSTTKVELQPNTVVCITPPDHSITEIANCSYDYLFSYFNFKDIVRIFRALMLEERVLVVGSDLSAVSLIAFSTLPLLSPLSYKGAILPILPDREEFLDYLDSPVPFVFGALNTDCLSKYDISSDITIINTDSKKVDYPDRMPHMANAEEMRQNLNFILQTFVKEPVDQNYWDKRAAAGIPLEVKMKYKLKFILMPYQTKGLFDIFHDYIDKLVSHDRLAGCRVRDMTNPDNPSVGFVKEAYMISVPDEDYSFIESFVSTQTFQAYCEETFFD